MSAANEQAKTGDKRIELHSSLKEALQATGSDRVILEGACAAIRKVRVHSRGIYEVEPFDYRELGSLRFWVGATVAFLASEDSTFITASVFPIDGGIKQAFTVPG